MLLGVILKLENNILGVFFGLFWLGLIMRKIDSRADFDFTAGGIFLDRVSLGLLALFFLEGTLLVDLFSS